jgi:ribosomal protein S18 acetylase RimI-like enzyme
LNKPVIERLRAEQWRVLRDLRIAALTDAPDAFSPTAEDARRHDDAYWQRGAERMSTAEAAMYLVRSGDRWIGLVSATRDATGLGHIGAMWVHPEYRAQRLGAALLDRALEFLDERSSRGIELSVTEGNERPITLYRSRGFELTGRAEPLRAGSNLRNLYMHRAAPLRDEPTRQ